MQNCLKECGSLTQCKFWLLVLALNFHSVSVWSTEPPSINDIERAWLDRQGRVNSARFEFTIEEFIVARTRMPHPPSRDVSSFLPKEDTTIQRSATVLVQDKMLRYSYRGEVFNPRKGGVRQKEYVSVSNEQRAKNFHRDVDGDQTDYPLAGFVAAEETHYDHDNYIIAPISLACRPLDLEMGGIDLATYKVNTTAGIVADRTCHILEPRESSKTRAAKTLWIDADRNYIVLRVVSSFRGKPLYSLDIEYIESDASEWVPKRWKYVEGGKNKLLSQLTAVVTAFRLNESISVSEFSLEFPEGTAVVDNRSSERYLTDSDSQKRIVTKEELARGATYVDLVSTESGLAKLPKRASGKRILMLLCGVVIPFVAFFGLRWIGAKN